MDDWTEAYFEHGYAQRWALERRSEKTEQEVDALWALLGLGTGSSVLDVGCGHGGHTVTFARHGAVVTGVDSSRTLLEGAQSLASECGAQVSLVRGDMRRLPFTAEQFTAGIMLYGTGISVSALLENAAGALFDSAKSPTMVIIGERSSRAA